MTSLPVNADNQINLGLYVFDGNGNPTTYKNAAFSFDPEDRLTSISSPAFSAAYDGDGLRAKKTAGGVTTYYVYDGGTPVAEESFNGTSATFTALNGITADGWWCMKRLKVRALGVNSSHGPSEYRTRQVAVPPK